eukprot:g13991.t1
MQAKLSLLLLCNSLWLALARVRGSICWGSVNCLDKEPFCECDCGNGVMSYVLNPGSCSACSEDMCDGYKVCSSGATEVSCVRSHCDRYLLEADGACHELTNAETGSSLFYSLTCTGLRKWEARYGLSCKVLSEPIKGGDNDCIFVQNPILGEQLLFSINVNCNALSTSAVIALTISVLFAALCGCLLYKSCRQRSSDVTVVRINTAPAPTAGYNYMPGQAEHEQRRVRLLHDHEGPERGKQMLMGHTVAPSQTSTL